MDFAVCQSFGPCGVCAGLNSFRVQGKLYARIHEVTTKFTSVSGGVSSPGSNNVLLRGLDIYE